jgi:hypothetical protein
MAMPGCRNYSARSVNSFGRNRNNSNAAMSAIRFDSPPASPHVKNRLIRKILGKRENYPLTFFHERLHESQALFDPMIFHAILYSTEWFINGARHEVKQIAPGNILKIIKKKARRWRA